MPSTFTSRLEGLTTSVAVKAPCRVATTAAITLSGLQTIDGVALSAGDRVLVKSQSSAIDNGIWIASVGAWTRAVDFDGTLDAVGGTQAMVLAGSVNGNTYWRVDGVGDVNIGQDGVTFVPALINDSATLQFLQLGTGAVPRSVQAKLRDIAHVSDFGAVGDGTTDDTAALQDAFDYASGNAPYGRTIIMDPLVYKTTTPLTISGNGAKIHGRNAKIDYRGTGDAIDFALVSGNYPVEVCISELNIGLTNATSPVVGVKVRASYSRFHKVNVVIGSGLASASGIELASDPSGSAPGPYYNVFDSCAVDSQSAGTNHFGFRSTTGSPSYGGANTNVFINCRMGSCAVGYEINGQGNVFHGCDNETPNGVGVAWNFNGGAAGMCSGNMVLGGYIEGALTAFGFSANAVGNIVIPGYGTGVTTWVDDSGSDNIVISANVPSKISTGLKFSALSSDSGALDYYGEGTWTAAIAGAGTAGTYEIATNQCTYTRIGRAVHLQGRIVLASSVTGGGTGAITITGLPFAKAANSAPQGAVSLGSVDLPADIASLAISFASVGASSTLVITEVMDNAAATNTGVSALAANDEIAFSITYFV